MRTKQGSKRPDEEETAEVRGEGEGGGKFILES